jgi:hypothetical protein
MYINKAKKIVIKIGSSTIVDKKGNFKKKWLLSLINDIKKLKKKKPGCGSCLFGCDCTWAKLFKNKK